MATPRVHLVLVPKHACSCGDRACRLMRCRVAGCVVADCGGHGRGIVHVREEHERACWVR